MDQAHLCYDLTMNQTESYCHDGITIRRKNLLNNRFYLYTDLDKDQEYNLLIFYHGSRDSAWYQLFETDLIKNIKNTIVVFGQCAGNIEAPSIHPYYKDITFGEIYWEILDKLPGFEEDLLYTQQIIADMKALFKIRKTYSIGHSNGGVHNLLYSLYLPNTFDAIVSHMGGMGYSPFYCLDFSLLQEADSRTPILFYTGDRDIHRIPCKQACTIFRNEGFDQISIYTQKNLSHSYRKESEGYMMDWLSKF